MTNQTKNKIRAQFEATMRAEPHHWVNRDFDMKGGDYVSVCTRAGFAAWQAACAQQSAQSQQDALDAARYRRIRNGPHSDNHGDLYAMSFQGDGDIVVKGERLDDFADAAIAAQGASNV